MADHGIQLYELLDGRRSPSSDAASNISSSPGGSSRERHRRHDHGLGHPETSNYAQVLSDNVNTSTPSLPSETDALPNAQPVDSREQQHHSATKETINIARQETTVRRPNLYLDVIRWWIPEIIASALSAASFTSIVIVLLVYDRRAVTGLNMPSGLTLNGIIALLATIGRVCLCAPVCSGLMQEMWLFFARESKRAVPKSRLRDLELFFKASYGTIGSLEFLIHTSGSKSIAVVGCMIMILSLVFSTFVQQLVAYEVMLARHSEPLGNIPRSESWAAVESTSFLPTLEMIGALYNGVIGGRVTPLAPNCLSGNCTWPITPSLAVCGECSERPFSVISCSNHTVDYYCQDESSAVECQDDMFCNYSLASGNSAEIWDAEKYSATLAGSYGSSTGFYSQLNPAYDESDFNRDYLIRFDLFGLPYAAGDLNSSSPASHQCSLWTCIDYYETSILSGQHFHKVVATNDNGSLGPVFGEGAHFTFGPVNIQEGGASTQVNFTGTSEALSAMKNFMQKVMVGSVNVSSTDTGAYTNDFMRGIWNGTTDIDAWIESVATSMTNVIRSNDQSERPEYNGSQYELAVKVRWLWIILPATLVLSSVLLMVTVMIRTAHSPVRSWKGSPLTLLLFDLDLAVRDAAYDRIEEYNGVEETVGGQTVRLVEKSNGRRSFVAA